MRGARWIHLVVLLLTISAPALAFVDDFDVDATSISMFGFAGAPAITDDSVTITNLTVNPMTLTITTSTQNGGNWLSASYAPQPLPGSDSSILTITADTRHLDPLLGGAQYHGTVTIKHGTTTKTVTVDLGVNGTKIMASPFPIALGSILAGNQQIQTTVTVSKAVGYGDATVAITRNPTTWLQVSKSTLNTQSTFIVTVTTNGLPAGPYAGAVALQYDGSGSPFQEVDIAVSFTIVSLVSVPNVVGLTQAAATTSLGGAGLSLGTVTNSSSPTVPAGSVISQNPTAGASVAPGSSVSLTVSTGPANVNVPNVVGLTQAAATTSIGGAGLSLGTVTNSSSPTVPAGSVISQNPTAGTSVAPGSAVNLTVSTGPANVNVPNVVGLTQAAATTSLGGAGLSLGTVTNSSSPTVPAGSVISQNPTAGTSVAPGSAVNLTVSTGPANVNVPNVVGLTQAAATTSLGGAGLSLGTVTNSSSPTVPAGSVISQNPTAGAWVAPASAVNLTLSTGPANVNVPNIVGLTQAAATTSLGGAGLSLGTVTNSSSPTIPAGSVISQNPTAGTSVASGSAVNLTVSIGPASVSVPNVVGLAQAAATTSLGGAGLSLGSITNGSSLTVPVGSVISQDPAAGIQVAPGFAVNLTVSTGASTDNTLLLSQFVGGGTEWNTTLFLTNLSNAAETFTLRFYDDDGALKQMPIDTLGTVNTITGTLNPGQTRRYVTGAFPTLQVAWALLTPGNPTAGRLSGLAVFRQTVPSGTSTVSSEAVVDFVGTSTSKYVLLYDNLAGFDTTAMFANPDSVSAMTILADIRDEQGNLLTTASITLPPLGHTAFRLTKRWPITIGQRGSIRLNANPKAFGGLGLRFSPFQTFTSFRLLTSKDVQ